MATIPEAFAIAVKLHQSGQLPAAKQIYEQILAAKPDHVDALHLLGVIASQSGQFDVAIDFICYGPNCCRSFGRIVTVENSDPFQGCWPNC